MWRVSHCEFWPKPEDHYCPPVSYEKEMWEESDVGSISNIKTVIVTLFNVSYYSFLLKKSTHLQFSFPQVGRLPSLYLAYRNCFFLKLGEYSKAL